jgi:KDO2-lipid IV(A) lauroyltransferase
VLAHSPGVTVVFRHLPIYADRLLGRLVKHSLASLRRTDPDRASDRCGATARRLGPLLPAHRIGRANLRAAFPDKDADWIAATLRGAWENLGRVAGEYVHLGSLWDYDVAHPNAGRIVTDDSQLFRDMHDDRTSWQLGTPRSDGRGARHALGRALPHAQ